mmetsp:Transcript_33486/g.69178  ORF Transcript_33486/g.69178 Transcript_33486/m.69178 type:complete len:209 (+) Transcript_33486:396-1022(+)
MATEFDHLVKLILLGDSGVGKSSLLARFADDQFKTSYLTTIGMDFKAKVIDVNGKKIKLQIWDTAGQERFRSVAAGYYRSAGGIILVYDVTDRLSFDHVSSWIEQIDNNALPDVCKVLVGNKSDMAETQVIDAAEGKALAEQYGMGFYETSAKLGTSVQDVFSQTALQVVSKGDGAVAAKTENDPVKVEAADPSEQQRKKSFLPKGCC